MRAQKGPKEEKKERERGEEKDTKPDRERIAND